MPLGGDRPGDLLQLEEEIRSPIPSEFRRVRELEAENSRLKKIVADLTLNREML